ncbi:sulfatase [Conexibacter sp. JD483]|uniref:sulfatase family protein n=1 Tax=Conexibacter sp. JD483 TaxID=3064471 RepID=UPI00287019F8|nr:sulfatase [Conexibacter sp. JD483]MDR9371732.1 sulfatase [Conexibacter sp. JD483]
MALSAFAPNASAADRPNVVVLMTDDQTVADLAAMPRARALLGREGVGFDRSYVSYPVCCPSRATFLSGQYAHNHGVLGLYAPTGGYARFNHANSLPLWLQQAGYATAHIGKYMNGYHLGIGAEQPPGWSEWYGAVDSSTYLMWGYTLVENGVAHTYGTPLEEDPRLYQTDVYRDKAVDFIRRRAPSSQPFFLSVAFLAPHHESGPLRSITGRLVRPAPRDARAYARARLPTPPGFAERDRSDKPRFVRERRPLSAAAIAGVRRQFRDRRASLRSVDDAVAAIVAALRRSGELDDTYVILTSDNGYMLGEHGVPNGKLLPYDPSTRVPLLIRGPGIPAGAVSHELVANTDLAPTITAVAGAVPGRVPDGRSLLPFARDPRLRSTRPLLHETGGWRYLRRRDQDAAGPPALRRVLTYNAVRTRRWLYVEYRDGERELYDLRRDPHELRSLHADPRKRALVRLLSATVRRLARCSGESCQTTSPSSLLH